MIGKKDISSPSSVNNLLKSNSPADLQKEDLFNTRPKAEAMRDFIKSDSGSLIKNKMLVLYGEWGSGKTTIFKFIENELNKDFETVFFEAWRHEKDDNLPLSLFDAVYEKVKNEVGLKDAFESIYSVMKGFAKSTKFNFGLVSIDNKEFIEEIEKHEMESAKSLFNKNKQFNEMFQKIEDAILAQGNKEKILVLIDDLDRCEPEKVLDLLSAIKLFFSYGRNTIYFCALDKEAITKAVTFKYGNVIKSDEYLEKVFDISFIMPEQSGIDRLLTYYFNEEKYANKHITNTQVIQKISQFLNSIKFTNPRHLKKILNKYVMVEYFKMQKIAAHDLIPEIVLDKDGNIINIIFVLFFIILHEFYPSKFYEIEQYDIKINRYTSAHFRYMINRKTKTSQVFGLPQSRDKIASILIPDLKNFTFKNLSDDFHNRFFGFLNIFTPYPKDSLGLVDGNFKEHDYLNQFDDSDNKILIDFAKYLLDEINQELKSHHYDYKILNLFKMAKTFL